MSNTKLGLVLQRFHVQSVRSISQVAKFAHTIKIAALRGNVIPSLIIGFTRLCQSYGVVIGLTILWAGIQIALDNRATVIYVAGYPNELLFSHFNPGFGYFCFGWGLMYSGIKKPLSESGTQI